MGDTGGESMTWSEDVRYETCENRRASLDGGGRLSLLVWPGRWAGSFVLLFFEHASLASAAAPEESTGRLPGDRLLPVRAWSSCVEPMSA